MLLKTANMLGELVSNRAENTRMRTFVALLVRSPLFGNNMRGHEKPRVNGQYAHVQPLPFPITRFQVRFNGANAVCTMKLYYPWDSW